MSHQIKIGCKVRLIEDISMHHRTYKAGEIFKVYGSSWRGWDLINDKGEKIDETLFSSNKYELFDIKEERRQKLRQINEKSSNII